MLERVSCFDAMRNVDPCSRKDMEEWWRKVENKEQFV